MANTKTQEEHQSITEIIPEGAEKESWLLLKAAHDARQVMPVDFPGFEAKVAFADGEEIFAGTMSYRRSTGTKIEISNLKGEPLDWLTDKLASLIGHRQADSFAEGDGRHPIKFGDKDSSPYGILVELHDRLNSKYRIKDNKVLEVTRTTPSTTFTISVIKTIEADPGKYLSEHFLVSYRNTASGALEQVDHFTDDYVKIAHVWLPQRRVVLTVTKEDISPRVRKINLSEINIVHNQ